MAGEEWRKSAFFKQARAQAGMLMNSGPVHSAVHTYRAEHSPPPTKKTIKLKLARVCVFNFMQSTVQLQPDWDGWRWWWSCAHALPDTPHHRRRRRGKCRGTQQAENKPTPLEPCWWPALIKIIAYQFPSVSAWWSYLLTVVQDVGNVVVKVEDPAVVDALHRVDAYLDLRALRREEKTVKRLLSFKFRNVSEIWGGGEKKKIPWLSNIHAVIFVFECVLKSRDLKGVVNMAQSNIWIGRIIVDKYRPGCAAMRDGNHYNRGKRKKQTKSEKTWIFFGPVSPSINQSITQSMD